MPRKKSDVNKTQVIREYLRDHPDALPKQASEDLKKQGLEVEPQRISVVKSLLKKAGELGGESAGEPSGEFGAGSAEQRGGRRGGRRGGKRAKRGGARRGAGRPRAAQATAGGDDVSYETLRRAKQLADQLGGVDRARSALEALAQLTG